jgi:hypothetical protein
MMSRIARERCNGARMMGRAMVVKVVCCTDEEWVIDILMSKKMGGLNIVV